MKNTILVLLLAGFVFTLQSCSKTGSTNTTPPDIINPPNGSGTLTVNLSQSQLTADGFDETTITVRDANNTDVTSGSTITVNNATISSNKFYTSMAGSYQVRATRGSDASAAVTLTANSPGPSPFTQKVVAEFFTGTWCGICPGTIIPLENYTNTNPNIITIGIHGPAGSSDPYKYIFDPQMRATFNIGGVPTVLLNRDTKWAGNNAGTEKSTIGYRL
jgi:thiol-disulfide isomerase/thioredoxin